MEEGEAAPVLRFDAPAQVVPPGDLVDSLVADDLLEDMGGRRPVDRAQHQEAAVEPGREQVLEIAVEAVSRLDQGMILSGGAEFPPQRHQVLAHPHEGKCPVSGEVEATDQFLAARLGGLVERAQGRPRRAVAIGRHRILDGFVVGAELHRHEAKERRFLRQRKCRVAVEDETGQGDA